MLLLIIPQDLISRNTNLLRQLDEIASENSKILEQPLTREIILANPKKTLVDYAKDDLAIIESNDKIQDLKEIVIVDEKFNRNIEDALEFAKPKESEEEIWITKIADIKHRSEILTDYYNLDKEKFEKISTIKILHEHPILKNEQLPFLPWSVAVRLNNLNENSLKKLHRNLRDLLIRINYDTKLIEDSQLSSRGTLKYKEISEIIKKEKANTDSEFKDIFEWAEDQDEKDIQENQRRSNSRSNIKKKEEKENTNEVEEAEAEEESTVKQQDDNEEEKEKSSWYDTIFSWKSLGIVGILILLLLIFFPINLFISI